MNTLEFFQLLCTVLTTIVGAGGFKVYIDTKKYNQEVEKLKAEVQAARTNTRGNELDNVKKAMEILMDEVVSPLKLEINAIRKELTKFRKAVEKANTCRFSADCPVNRELQQLEKHESKCRDSPKEHNDYKDDTDIN